MLVDAQPVRNLHRIADRRPQTKFSPADASTTTSKTLTRCCKSEYRFAFHWPCQKAFWRSANVCTTAEEVDQEVAEHVSAP